jgi:regulator of replication initiation timing
LKQRRDFFIGSARFSVASLALVTSWVALTWVSASAQQPVSTPGDTNLAESVRELREQVQELRSAVADMKSEAAQYRSESAELRKELETLRASSVGGQSQAAQVTAPAASTAQPDQRVAALEETTQLLQSEIRGQYQTKIESASKYRVRFSGLALLNLFHNNGLVDNLDFPTYAIPSNPYFPRSSFGATLRQSELGLEVFGPELAGARTSAEVQLDFGGGFPSAALDGINTGLVRLRTANMRLDWKNTSLIVGQDGLFISPLSPTSFASLAIPSLGYSGNLWAWTPQVRVEHKFDFSTGQNVIVQAGILDNVTGEPSYGSHRQPQAGEVSGQPAYAVRLGWNRNLNGRPVSVGTSGYYSRQNWGFDWYVDGWAAATDWRVPIASRVELSGEFYRGRAVGGLGGGIGQSILFSGNPLDPASDFRGVNSAGGWSQIKFSATPRIEFNGAFGVDDPYSADIHAYPSPVGYYPAVLAANRSAMMNFIYRPRSDLLLSAEYRHLRTSEIGALNTADQVNLIMGILF